MGSGAAKRARQAVFQEGRNPESLPPQQRKYIVKEINKLASEFERATKGKEKILTRKGFPCQKMKNQFAYLNPDDVPELGEDNKWYLNGELIVSDWYKAKQAYNEANAKLAADRKAAIEAEKNVTALKPEVLGDADNS